MLSNIAVFDWYCTIFALTNRDIETYINHIWNPAITNITNIGVLGRMNEMHINIEPNIAKTIFISACECDYSEVARWVYRRYEPQLNSEEISIIFMAALNHDDLDLLTWICMIFGKKQGIPTRKFFAQCGIKY
jgi:hypothetical protein